ncbi:MULTISPECIES: ABC transporter ATP-binding protein [unclassified Cellulophaga]|uniref:ABC transporter ATP-binding protein n=1 Tax=unclassified Cellulophaga TaxID=2634405 RepID=UPI0026E14742|nr:MULTISPECIES: ABC transporter ATP-binding protein [unclassified Cellulophaga]MDO6491226.1 ABC transporter ATP-binding protein [Cellulophaga sp. 2_MG-2023]MDO6495241.1 ABC transporter ATP-binding protein [Cellulophaga sp. 3_MG-2023]
MLHVNNITFSYNTTPVLKDIDFTVNDGEYLAILGESGSGKSTLLKIIYGILQLDKGTIFWDDNQVLGPDYNLIPGEKYMKYLSQDFDLMPFITVEENVSQYLSVFYPEELKARTDELLEMVEMTSFAKTKVKLLSGGQQQRVALARVLAQEPEILLLDEPFSHIDNFRKNSLRRRLFGYLKRKKITCIVATHDEKEVLPFADRILVVKDQEILANEKTETLYNNPKSLYVASLFAEANLLPISTIKEYTEAKKDIVVYAHEFKVSETSGIEVRVINSYAMGSYYLMEGITEDQSLFFTDSKSIEVGKNVFLNVSLEVLNKRLA